MDRYDEARVERDRSRLQLSASMSEAKRRLKPAALASAGLQEAKAKIRAEPSKIASLAALAAVVILRKPIFNVLRRALKEKRK